MLWDKGKGRNAIDVILFFLEFYYFLCLSGAYTYILASFGRQFPAWHMASRNYGTLVCPPGPQYPGQGG